VTQRGVDRRETFSAAGDRETYLNLIRQNLEDAGVRPLAWCLSTNHSG
jgi:REP element-mobilizing transposase RayT